MRKLSLQSKFKIGMAAVIVVALSLMLGVRMLGKAAQLHYLEREGLAMMLKIEHSMNLVEEGGRSADKVTKQALLDAVERTRTLAGSVPNELLRVEIFAFEVMGFRDVVELPGKSKERLDHMRQVLMADPSQMLTAETVVRMRSDMDWIRQQQDRFGPLVQDATGLVKTLVLSINMIGILIIIGVFGMLRSSTLGPLRQALQAAQRIADGDLSGARLSSSSDEVGQLNAAIEQMKTNLGSLVGDVRGHTEDVARAIAEVASGSRDLSARTEHQAAALQEVAASVAELSQSVRTVGQQMREADEQAERARHVAADGGHAVQQAVTRMDEISQASRRVADINDVINGIAFQTNILALNAAVEAARAGEHGRGFSVVASEVRTLAQRSAAAAREIASLIGSTMEKVEQGTNDVNLAGQTIREVVASVQHVSKLVTGLTRELAAQEASIGQIDQSMKCLDGNTQQNAAMAEQSASAAASVGQQAGLLVKAVDNFQLAGDVELPSAR